MKNQLAYTFFFSSIFIFTFPLVPQTAPELKDRGNKFYEAKDLVSAISAYQKSLAKNPNYVPAMLGLGKALRENGSLLEAERILEKAAKYEKSEDILYELSKTKLSLRKINEAEKIILGRMKEKPYASRFGILYAQVLLEKGRVHLARRRLQSQLVSRPNSVYGWVLLARCYRLENNLPKARSALHKALLIKPDDNEVIKEKSLLSLNLALISLGDSVYSGNFKEQNFSEVLQDIDSARALDPMNVDSNLLSAKIYSLAGNCNAAADFLENVLRINPEHKDALYLKALCKPSASENILRRLLAYDQNNDLLRHAYQMSLLRAHERREYPETTSQSRYHLDFGKTLFNQSQIDQGWEEINWSLFLYPSFIRPHQLLMARYRNERDYAAMFAHASILHAITKKQKYSDILEQLSGVKRKSLAYRFAISDVRSRRTLSKVFVYDLKPVNILAEMPGAGRLIADRIHSIIERKGRITTLAYPQRKRVYEFYRQRSALYNGAYFSQTGGRKLASLGFGVDYIVDGKYRNLSNGLSLTINIINAKNGKRLKTFSKSVTGRGYLRALSLAVANFLYSNVPFRGKILKISNGRFLINLGKIDGLTKSSQLNALTTKGPLPLKLLRVDPKLSLASPQNSNDIFIIKPNDQVSVK